MAELTVWDKSGQALHRQRQESIMVKYMALAWDCLGLYPYRVVVTLKHVHEISDIDRVLCKHLAGSSWGKGPRVGETVRWILAAIF